MRPSARSREELYHEHVPRSKVIERRWSAPTTPTRWQDIHPRWSDITFKDNSACSDTEAYETNKAYEELRILTENEPEPIQDSPHCFMKCSHDVCKAFILSHMSADIVREHECHECTSSAPRRVISNMKEAYVPAPTTVDDLRLRLYALDIRGMTQRAMDDLLGSGGTEPFPVYNEVDYIEGIDPYSSEPESAVTALRASIEAFDEAFDRPRSNYPIPLDNNDIMATMRNLSIDEQSIAGNATSSNASPFNSNNCTRPSTRPSSAGVGATDNPRADPLGDRRVRRKEACYFSTSEDQRNADNKSLIKRSLRDSRDG